MIFTVKYQDGITRNRVLTRFDTKIENEKDPEERVLNETYTSNAISFIMPLAETKIE